VKVSRSERVEAPREVVWNQLGFTPAFFGTLPVADTRVADDGRSATFVVRLGFGPVAMKRPASFAIAEARTPERMVLDGRLDNDAIRVSSTFDLAVTAEDETQLTYEVNADLAHTMPRLSRVLASLVDDHVTDYVKRVAEASGRQFKAEQALGGS
jgi:carbon monoxide dehydrogenase subunit G